MTASERYWVRSVCEEIIGGKLRFLPEVNAEPGKDPEQPAAGKYPCPCCGNNTLPVPQEDAIAYICPICLWENDVFIRSEEEPSDENHGMTLRQAKECFRKTGSCRSYE